MRGQVRALVTGISGQDGSYLAEFLLARGYRVFGTVRRSSNPNYERIAHLRDRIELVYADLADQASLTRTIHDCAPDEIYNLAAQSFVPASWEQPVLTADFTALGVSRLLEAIRAAGSSAKFYQASSSEMFGRACETPQNEATPFYPRSPYGVAKAFGHHLTVNYRESYGMFAVSGILFNHESPRRGLEFVTRKITDAVARIVCGKTDRLILGNLEARRDWGFAGDYVRAMWMMLQQDEPQDFVIATGVSYTVREFAEIAFATVGLDYSDYVITDPFLLRPAEVDHLTGDAGKAKARLGWRPEVPFEEWIEQMVRADLTRHGFESTGPLMKAAVEDQNVFVPRPAHLNPSFEVTRAVPEGSASPKSAPPV